MNRHRCKNCVIKHLYCYKKTIYRVNENVTQLNILEDIEAAYFTLLVLFNTYTDKIITWSLHDPDTVL